MPVLTQIGPAGKPKGVEQGARRLDGSQHCPSPGPTRLAAGLELEVFYTKCLIDERLVIRPVFR